jgi:DNA-binding PadR family transcriptional regulator
MSRWSIRDGDPERNTDAAHPREERLPDSGASSVSVGRGPAECASANSPEKPDKPTHDPADRSPAPRTQHRHDGRTYSLRSSEIAAMRDIGTFRTLDVENLTQFAYAGAEARLKYDLESLRAQGLVEEKTVFRAHKEPRKLVTLTEKGHRILRKTGALPKDQVMYHGYVKRREIHHDVDLYKVYQEAAEEIRTQGGKPTRVRLDFELKAAVQRAKNAVKNLPEKERVKRLEAFAKDHGLTIRGTTIHVPDVQVEFETREGELERTNLELVSENYRTEGIRSKAASGFTIYARGGDTTRIRRALQDTHAVERILSV